MKTCSKCKQEKLLIDFHKGCNYCKICKKQYNIENKQILKYKRSEYHIKHKDSDNQKTAEYYQKNKSIRKQYYENNKEKFHNYYINTNYGSPEKQIKALLKRCKKRALKDSLLFDLDYDFIISLFQKQEGKCLLTNLTFDLDVPQGSFIRPFSMSIDKINVNIGYIKTNVRLVCSIVNFAIGEFGLENFDKMCISYLSNKGKYK